MNCYRSRTAVLRNLCDFNCIDRLFIEAFSEFYSNRKADCLCHSFYDFPNKYRIFHQRRPFSVVNNLRNRTSHVDINKLISLIFQRLCHISHQLRLRAKELDSQWLFLRICCKKRKCILIFIIECFRADHLCIEQAAALLLTQQTKWQVCNACHRSEDKGIFHCNVSNPQCHRLSSLSFFLLFM